MPKKLWLPLKMAITMDVMCALMTLPEEREPDQVGQEEEKEVVGTEDLRKAMDREARDADQDLVKEKVTQKNRIPETGTQGVKMEKLKKVSKEAKSIAAEEAKEEVSLQEEKDREDRFRFIDEF